MKILIEAPTIYVLDADKKGIKLNNVGTVFITGVPNT